MRERSGLIESLTGLHYVVHIQTGEIELDYIPSGYPCMLASLASTAINLTGEPSLWKLNEEDIVLTLKSAHSPTVNLKTRMG